MWKVVVTEIQDASAFEPFDVPVGAFSVSKERFARTMERLDLPSLIDTLEAMQSAQGTRGKSGRLPAQELRRTGVGCGRTRVLKCTA